MSQSNFKGYLLLIAGLISNLAHWSIWEYDLFYLIRAGEEIIRDRHVQDTDTWSH
jgi:hypothetical protein